MCVHSCTVIPIDTTIKYQTTHDHAYNITVTTMYNYCAILLAHYYGIAPPISRHTVC